MRSSKLRDDGVTYSSSILGVGVFLSSVAGTEELKPAVTVVQVQCRQQHLTSFMLTAQFAASQTAPFSPTRMLNVALGKKGRGKSTPPQPPLRTQPAVAQASKWIFPSVHAAPKGAAIQWPGFTSEPSPARPTSEEHRSLSCPMCVFKPEAAPRPSHPFSLGPGDNSAFLQAFLPIQVGFW